MTENKRTIPDTLLLPEDGGFCDAPRNIHQSIGSPGGRQTTQRTAQSSLYAAECVFRAYAEQSTRRIAKFFLRPWKMTVT